MSATTTAPDLPAEVVSVRCADHTPSHRVTSPGFDATIETGADAGSSFVACPACVRAVAGVVAAEYGAAEVHDLQPACTVLDAETA